MTSSDEEHILLKALLDLQSIKDDLDETRRFVCNLKIWEKHKRLKSRTLNRLVSGQRHLIVVLYYMFLAVDRSPKTALHYIQSLRRDNISFADDFSEVVDRFDRLCGGQEDPNQATGIDTDFDFADIYNNSGLHGVANHEDDEDDNIDAARLAMSSAADDDDTTEVMFDFGDNDKMDDDEPQSRTGGEDAGEALLESTTYVWTTEDVNDGEIDVKEEAMSSSHGLTRTIIMENNGEEDSLLPVPPTPLSNVDVDAPPDSLLPQSNGRVVKRRQVVKNGERADAHGLKRGTYGCSMCDKIFPIRFMLSKHYKAVHGRLVGACPMCGNFFEGSHVCLDYPEVTVDVVDPKDGDAAAENDELGCYYCGHASESRKELAEHISGHANEDPYCQMCRKAFNKRDSLRMHYKTTHMHAQLRRVRFKCNICGKQIWSKGALNDHLRAHKGEKPFTCDICGRSFTYHSGFKIHQSTHAQAANAKSFKCEVCDKTFRLKTGLLKHMERHANRAYDCPVCKKRLPTEGGLRKHMFYHTEKAKTRRQQPKSLKYGCNICQKTYSNSLTLKYHMRVHTGDSPFVCKVCGKLSTDKHKFEMHKLTHIKGDNCQCNICGKWFSNDHYLDNHKTIHSDQTYPCKDCLTVKVFNTRTQLYKHRKKYH